MNIVGISGSPSARSRSAWLLQLALTRLEASASASTSLQLRDLPADALLSADARHPLLHVALQRVAQAQVVVVATPVYKAAYSGLLKVFFDLLPTDALADKTVLPLATGGSAGHQLALDYTLRPLLAAVGARHVLDSVFATDAQLTPHESGGYVPGAELLARLERALQPVRLQPLPEAGRCTA
jgi:FMN reductase